MHLGLSDRTALVTGAGGGLGQAIALGLAAEGARVAACDISQDALQATLANAPDGADIRPYVFDLSDFDAVASSVQQVQSELAEVDILVNITGGPPPTPAAETKAADWEHYFHSLVSSVLHLTEQVLPGMRERKWGRIVTSTSSGVIAPIPNLAISNGLRASLLSWSKTLAGEVGRDGVTVNTIVPGRIATQRITALDQAKAARDGISVDEVSAASTAAIPLGRYGNPEEYAAGVVFLASEQASYITGTVLRVDGGLIASI